MIYVIEASYLENYKIRLRFNDNKEGIIDLEDVIHNDHRTLFKELSNTESFKRFHVEMDTIVWENGLDLAPEFLWEKVTHSNLDKRKEKIQVLKDIHSIVDLGDSQQKAFDSRVRLITESVANALEPLDNTIKEAKKS